MVHFIKIKIKLKNGTIGGGLGIKKMQRFKGMVLEYNLGPV